ncbi:MAG: UDP-N-acetylmuramate dehydrogenase [Polyangiales bacterium]|nr:UDP-N-acetylmuramate dehydrogenase [Myxococcales bacterium]
MRVDERVPLAPWTTFELGGLASYFVEAASADDVGEALAWARARNLPSHVLGGGSNLVVADEGFAGLIVALRSRGVTVTPTSSARPSSPVPTSVPTSSPSSSGARVRVRAEAGEPWDAFVEACVARGLAGVECLSGIPGLVGATPVQNVGAYGQEVADTIVEVETLETRTGGLRTFTAAECDFSYRSSRFKAAPGEHVVLAVTFELVAGPPAPPRYGELSTALVDAPAPTLAAMRETVLRLRRAKSMVLDAGDPNRRSAGSFFTNPVLPAARAQTVIERAVAEGLVASPGDVPQYPAGEGRVKLAAGWLIERAGLQKGMRDGAFGLSTRHALAIVHHGGGTTAELVRFACSIRDRVHGRFGVELTPEPVFLGHAWSP